MNHNLNRNNYLMIAASTTAATFFTLIIFASSTTTSIVTPVEATSATGNNTTTTTMRPSLGLEFSAQPIWDETVRTTAIIPINQTHSMATFEGNGTMRVPDTGEIINMTNNGTAFGSIVPQANDTVISYGRENVFSVDDGDTSAITFFEIIQYNPATFEGNGLVLAVFDRNATGSLAPFNGMMVVGTHEESPATQEVIIRLWQWESGMPLSTNTTTTSTSTATSETNVTTTATGTTDGGGEEATIGLSEGQKSPEEEQQAAEEQEEAAIGTSATNNSNVPPNPLFE